MLRQRKEQVQYVFAVAFESPPYSGVEECLQVVDRQPAILCSGWCGAPPYIMQHDVRVSFRGKRGPMAIIPSTFLPPGEIKNRPRTDKMTYLFVAEHLINDVVSPVERREQPKSHKPRRLVV